MDYSAGFVLLAKAKEIQPAAPGRLAARQLRAERFNHFEIPEQLPQRSFIEIQQSLRGLRAESTLLEAVIAAARERVSLSISPHNP